MLVSTSSPSNKINRNTLPWLSPINPAVVKDKAKIGVLVQGLTELGQEKGDSGVLLLKPLVAAKTRPHVPLLESAPPDGAA